MNEDIDYSERIGCTYCTRKGNCSLTKKDCILTLGECVCRNFQRYAVFKIITAKKAKQLLRKYKEHPICRKRIYNTMQQFDVTLTKMWELRYYFSFTATMKTQLRKMLLESRHMPDNKICRLDETAYQEYKKLRDIVEKRNKMTTCKRCKYKSNYFYRGKRLCALHYLLENPDRNKNLVDWEKIDSLKSITPDELKKIKEIRKTMKNEDC